MITSPALLLFGIFCNRLEVHQYRDLARLPRTPFGKRRAIKKWCKTNLIKVIAISARCRCSSYLIPGKCPHRFGLNREVTVS